MGWLPSFTSNLSQHEAPDNASVVDHQQLLDLLLAIEPTSYLRKRKVIASGNPKALLRLHEVASWLGTLLVLIHAGIHFNALLPWLATVAMGINVISGMVGKLLLGRSRQHVQGQREQYQLRGLSRPEVEQAVFWDAVTLNTMTQWRKVHIPIFSVFTILSLGHIFSIFLFWGWL